MVDIHKVEVHVEAPERHIKALTVGAMAEVTLDAYPEKVFVGGISADLAYFRLHGRNRNWFNVPRDIRYDYLYSDEELRQFIEPIGKVSGEAAETLIFFNNHPKGSAIENAKTLKNILA